MKLDPSRAPPGHSQAVIADAIHSASDLSTDLLCLFGVKLWAAPRDANTDFQTLRSKLGLAI